MKLKLMSLVITFMTMAVTNAQQSFFETLDAQGTGTEYQTYYSVYKDDKGKQILKTTGGKAVITKTMLQELPAGVLLNNAGENKKTSLIENYNAKQKSAIDFIGYPNTRMVYNSRTGHGYVAIDNYVFHLRDIERGHIGFGSIGSMYIVDGSAKKSGKKKKKGAFWGKLKDAALNQSVPDQGSGPEYNAAMELDLEVYVMDYLKKMKTIADGYTLTAKDKADIARLKKAASDDTKLANKKNAEFWASPEGQAIKENNRRAEGSSRANNVTLRNNSSSTIFVGTSGSDNRGTEISPGSSATWSCSQDAFIQQVTKVSNTRSFKSTSNRVYRANSGCGSTVNVN